MRKRVWLLTGTPGVGKTTVLLKAVDILKAQGVGVGGMASREVREGGIRVGFEILDLASGTHGWLAHVNQQGPSVGKYHINLQDLDGIGAEAIAKATEKCTVIAIDEVGPMELYSNRFKQAVAGALESSKPMLAVMYAKAKDPLITTAKQRSDAEVVSVTRDNRMDLAKELARQIYVAFKSNPF